MSHKVLIVEDQSMSRRLLEIYIESEEQYELVGSIANADNAVHYCQTMPIDLILMDVLTEYGASGLDAAEAIKSRFPRIKIIVITSMPEASWLERAKRIGVESFWYKESEAEEILNIMDRTMEGESIYPDSAPLVYLGLAKSTEFTEREIEVLRELITGDCNAQIAKRLYISLETVKFHVKSMLQKTGFRTRTELATQARSLGLVIN